MSDEPIWQWSAVKTAAAIRDRLVSSEEVIRSHVERMREVNPKINAVAYDLGDKAIEQAKQADRDLKANGPKGPLHGVPVTIKQNVDVAGLPTSNGVVAFKDLIAKENSPQVDNLLNAGAIIIGITNAPEFSFRVVTDNPLHGLTLNPWNKDITCGGSSGGAGSSLAAGIGCIAHGNDIGGSLRWPAHCNGIATIKPSLGRVPSYNSSMAVERPLTAQISSVQGPLARSVEDVFLGLKVMSRGDYRDPWWVPAPLVFPDSHIKRIGKAKIPDDMDTDLEIVDQYHKAANWLKEEGYEVEEVELPNLNKIWEIWNDLIFGESRYLLEKNFLKVVSDDFKKVWKAYCNFREKPDMESFLLTEAERAHHLRNWLKLLEEYPVILTPASTLLTPGPRADLDGDEAVFRIFFQNLRFISPISILGLPAATVPVGRVNRNPVGVQLIGNKFREDLCLRIAQTLEDKAGLLVHELWNSEGN